MAPVPEPSPALHPAIQNANTAWKFSANMMNWFSKLVTTAYTWTDLLIKGRQKKVDNAYNTKMAEQKAAEIMKQQQENGLAKRSPGGDAEEARLEQIFEAEGVDRREFEEFLRSLEEE